VKYNEKMSARYEKSAFGGVDIWFILGALGSGTRLPVAGAHVSRNVQYRVRMRAL
jgi:hypothetical protein